jgi:hypothetical protein
VPYPSVFDVRGDIRTWLGSIGQPVTVFYGADGEMVRTIDGEISEQDLAAGLDAIAG